MAEDMGVPLAGALTLAFFLGMILSYHEMDDFENSVRNLEFVVSSNDSIQQYSSYYLGASYLQLGYLNYFVFLSFKLLGGVT